MNIFDVPYICATLSKIHTLKELKKSCASNISESHSIPIFMVRTCKRVKTPGIVNLTENHVNVSNPDWRRF